MNKELYFLRSSEQKIVNDMIKYAHPKDSENLSIYSDFYGLTAKDLGVYEKFGFEKADDSDALVMVKKLEKKAVVRPTDGYDPTRWMD